MKEQARTRGERLLHARRHMVDSTIRRCTMAPTLARRSFIAPLPHGAYTARVAQTSSSTPATVISSHSLSRQLSGLGPST
jgi:hypothetical protein